MNRFAAVLTTGLLLLSQQAWASDYSGLMPFYIVFVLLLGGIAAGFEWVIINAVMERGDDAVGGDPESQNRSRFGCGLGVALWAVNAFVAHLVIINVWG